MQDCRQAFLSEALEDRRDAVTWPVAALTLVRGQDGRIDVWTFADTTAFVRYRDGTVVTLGEASDLRRSESDMAAVLLRQAGCSPKDLLQAPAFRAWLADRREVQTQGGGVALFGLQPETAGRLRHESVSLPPGTNVLLTSDGFSALVDLYRHLDAKALMEAALVSGLSPWRRPRGVSKPRWTRTRSAFRASSSATTPRPCSSCGKHTEAQRLDRVLSCCT